MTAKSSREDKKPFKEKHLQQLGDRIRALRKKQGYANYEIFAYKHNISRSQVGRYENGEDLRFSTLIRILKALDVTLEEFFREGFDD